MSGLAPVRKIQPSPAPKRPRAEAADYIAKYFAQYPGIREYMDTTIEFAHGHGYVLTLDGRRVHLPPMKGPTRQFAERAAINAPLQGSAADIIKRAMTGVSALLKKEQGARLLLQVHDELVFDVPRGEVEAAQALVQSEMENVIELRVPLVVAIGTGENWMET